MRLKTRQVEVEVEKIIKTTTQKIVYICPYCDANDEYESNVHRHILTNHTYKKIRTFVTYGMYNQYVYKFDRSADIELFIEIKRLTQKLNCFSPGWYILIDDQLIEVGAYIQMIKQKLFDTIQEN
jgi:biotin synthase-like enzyme